MCIYIYVHMLFASRTSAATSRLLRWFRQAAASDLRSADAAATEARRWLGGASSATFIISNMNFMIAMTAIVSSMALLSLLVVSLPKGISTIVVIVIMHIIVISITMIIAIIVITIVIIIIIIIITIIIIIIIIIIMFNSMMIIIIIIIIIVIIINNLRQALPAGPGEALPTLRRAGADRLKRSGLVRWHLHIHISHIL